MKQSTVLFSGLVCAVGVAVSAMELPTLKLVFPSRERAARTSVPQCCGPLLTDAVAMPVQTTTGPVDGDTLTRRAADLQHQLDLARAREDKLQAQVVELNKELARKNDWLLQATREMKATRQELVTVNAQLAEWSDSMAQLRGQVRAAEADNLATTQTLIKFLQEFMKIEPASKKESSQTLDAEKPLSAPRKPDSGSELPQT